MYNKIETILYNIEPFVNCCGGKVLLEKYTTDSITLIVKGSCTTCISNKEILKTNIYNIINKILPEIKLIVIKEE